MTHTANGYPEIHASDLAELHISGHVIAVYPRREEVIVDGFKHYRASKHCIRVYRQMYPREP